MTFTSCGSSYVDHTLWIRKADERRIQSHALCCANDNIVLVAHLFSRDLSAKKMCLTSCLGQRTARFHEPRDGVGRGARRQTARLGRPKTSQD